MIISSNRSPSLPEFTSLIDSTTCQLNISAKSRPDYFLSRHAQLLEDDVVEVLKYESVGTPFEGTIEKISGQRFPDIVAGKYYGVEVKSSKDEKWITLGGSVNESTRIEDVERIFLTFGKLVKPIEFRSRPYEDCLSDVVVTHYPRYRIDMNLTRGDTIFERMETTYDELRLSGNPVGKVVEYYRSQLGEGESLWWTGEASASINSLEEAVPMKVRLWRTLSTGEKHELMVKGLAYFPSLLSSSNNKYEQFSLWLAAKHGIVSTSMRDTFTAGGQETIITSRGVYKKVPQAFVKIFDNIGEIALSIYSADENFLSETWQVRVIKEDRLNQWIDLIASKCELENHNVTELLKSIFDKD